MTNLNQVLLVSIIVLTFVRYCELRSLRRNSELEDKKHHALAQYFCHQYSTCTHGGDKVCGFDEESSYLAVFEDYCTLLQVNCKGGGAKIFFRVEYQVCETKSNFEYKYVNETAEFERLTTTEEPEYDENHVKLTSTLKTFPPTSTTIKATTKKKYPKIPKIKWKTKPQILSLRRRRFYMPFLK